LDDPADWLPISGSEPHKTGRCLVGLILIERPLLKESTRRLLLQIGFFFFVAFPLNRLRVVADAHDDSYCEEKATDDRFESRCEMEYCG
jgi:hypothetical protein